MPPASKSQYRQPGDMEPLTPEEIYEDLRAAGVPHEVASRQAGIPGWGAAPLGSQGLASRPRMGMMPGAGTANQAPPSSPSAPRPQPSPEPGYPSGRPSDGLGRIEPSRNAQYEQTLDFPRRWSSADQRFTLEGGQLVGIHSNGQVDILRPDGRTVHPHISELSPEDQQHVYKKRESMADFRAENIEREPAPAPGVAPGIGDWTRPTVPDTRRARASQAREAGRRPMPGRGQAMPRRGDLLAAEADLDQAGVAGGQSSGAGAGGSWLGNGAEINNLEGAEPAARRPQQKPARPQLPPGFVPIMVRPRQDETGRYQPFRGRGEMYEEPGSMDRTPKMLETESPLSVSGNVIGIGMDGNVLFESPDGRQSQIHLSQLSGRDAAHIVSSLPSNLAGRVQIGNPEDLRKARADRERYMWEERTGFVGDGRDLDDTEAKLAEFRRQRRAGMRPGTNAEQQYEMFGPGGDDAAARAEAQADIDARAAAGAQRDRAVQQGIARESEKYGPGRGVVRYDSKGNPIPAEELTQEQRAARSKRKDVENRAKLDPTRERAIINNLARRARISVEEATRIYEEGRANSLKDAGTPDDPARLAAREAGLKPLRNMAATARNAQLNSQQDALRSRNMLAGNDPRANLTNAFGTMSKEWQDYVMARLMGADPGASPSDAAIEREKIGVAQAEAEARAAEAARAGRQADRANDLAERGLGLKEKDQAQSEAAARDKEAADTRNLIIRHHKLPMPAGAAGELVESEISSGRFDHPEVVKFVNRSALKLLDDAGAWDDEKLSDEEVAAVDSILSRLGVGYQPGSWRKAAEDSRRARRPSFWDWLQRGLGEAERELPPR